MDYKEKLERAKELYPTANADQRYVLECLFPELAESEDERIRKKLIFDFQVLGKTEWGDLKVKDILAWLEKQGEQKTYGQRAECLDCQFNYAGECKGSCSIKRNEQKPAWSEEDETGWTNTMIMIKEVASNHYTKDSVKLVVNWLKSIKQRIKGE